ncbi:hypothetical protein ABZV80_40980 [Streptomyces sp. NPDC005132]|uniref:hypothetical protein n=1 Tax=Streptomyces sp. NPDC005132 TaxID=3154294 RepID=UPI0033AB86AF
MLTTTEVRDHIRGLSDVDSLLAVQVAATARLLQLDAAQKPLIAPGRTCRIDNSIRPASLRGLTGTVQQPNRTRSRFDILLDEDATNQLRNRQDPANPRFKIPDGAKRYRLSKVPGSCIELTDTPADL